MTTRPAPSHLLPERLFGWMRNGWQVLFVWTVSRMLMGLIYATPYENDIFRDAHYYWRMLEAMGTDGIGVTMPEYPTPVLWIMQIPHVGGLASDGVYIVGFAVMMLALDGLLTWLIWRSAGRRRTAGLDFWLIFIFLIGPLAFFRFDMLPAVLVGAALILSQTRPRLAGALTAVGAAVKLWPALLFPALLTRRGATRIGTTVGFVVVGLGLALASLVVAGWDRTVSPLGYQSDRGLQIESLFASPLMLARAFNPEPWTVELSVFKAFEIFGPGVAPLLTVSTIATVLGMLAIVALLLRGFRCPAMDTWRVSLLVLAIVMIMIITNKTLSPQYLIWLGGPLALMLVRAPSGQRRLVTRRLALSLLPVAVLTHIVYPITYPQIFTDGASGMAIASVIMVIRNLALLVIGVWMIMLTWRQLPADAPVRDVGTS
ncbi:glycosyltransferase 87 family protein [Propionibacteriaceae bacterium Y1700]|uniref:glycosyltransferase 87 family protein n=1 Tax=Microlunatus sp. Y1700 TaxID=3418487 RepID=UPI003DA70E8B